MASNPTNQRLLLAVRGLVQGVGFRPFVHRLANDLALTGIVRNTRSGAAIEIEGPLERLEAFQTRLLKDLPAPAAIHSCEASWLDPAGYTEFSIDPSEAPGGADALVLPDLATCPDCMEDLFNPSNRRYRYPFTNCTRCGPRFTIIEQTPYDRPHTTMKGFTMCPVCQREYEDPADRRFHAQPNACPACGPRLTLLDREGAARVHEEEALQAATGALRDGLIVAVKGLGGFHLLVDALDDDAVYRLREKKRREEKPLAVMFPSMESLRMDLQASPAEEGLLQSPQAPIVLLDRRSDSRLAPWVAPDNPCIGAMLPYTPLHHLLLRDLGFPLVATSGNLSDEPICIDNREAVERLGGIADLFLVHDRPIVRHVDDSLVRVLDEREMVLRRARGYAPAPVLLSDPQEPALGVGGHLKNTVALVQDREVFLSQHLGDLENDAARQAFEHAVNDLQTLFHIKPARIICDQHPDYSSSRFAREANLPESAIQHHYAHVVANMAENDLNETVLGISWDGTGWGGDGTIWGGEFLVADRTTFTRFAHLRTFALPGGEQAVKEPRRSALGLLYELYGEDCFARSEALRKVFSDEEKRVLLRMLENGVNAPRTSSMGRLFDAATGLAGIRAKVSFEGQAALSWEGLAHQALDDTPYPAPLRDPTKPEGPRIADWADLIEALLEDLARETDLGTVARRFHSGCSEWVLAAARQAGLPAVVLTGGCFQNRLLSLLCKSKLESDGFRVYLHQRVPPNDGGLALGQVAWKGCLKAEHRPPITDH